MIDLSQYSVVDSHCHPFLPGRERSTGSDETKEFYQLFNVSTLSISKEMMENVIMYRKMMKELSRVLGCSFEFDEILKRRNEEYTKPREYIAKLFDEAKIDTLILDMGFPSEEYTGYSVPLEEFQKLVKRKLKCIYRLEPLWFRLFHALQPFDEMLEKYIESLESAVKVDGYVGFKSVQAYLYGLKIKDDERSARDIYKRLSEKKLLTVPFNEKTPQDIRDEKILRDYLVCRGIEKSIDLDVPFQIHTGTGDSPYIDLRDANPLHLFEVITDEKLGKAKIVLVHAGYPYVEEAGFLANNYPNVYIDLSEMIPFVGTGMKDKILQLLYMSPVTKIMYGSDGYNIPEIFWIAAIWGKRAISEALQELVKSEAIDEDYAYKAGSLILSENTNRLYK